MAARSRDSQRQEASGPMDWPPPVRMSGWILKITFFTGYDFLVFFLYKTVILARFGPTSKKCENCENQFTALTLMSCTWLHRVRQARWPRWGVPTCESGFAAGAKKTHFGQVEVSLYFSFTKQWFRHIFDQNGQKSEKSSKSPFGHAFNVLDNHACVSVARICFRNPAPSEPRAMQHRPEPYRSARQAKRTGGLT